MMTAIPTAKLIHGIEKLLKDENNAAKIDNNASSAYLLVSFRAFDAEHYQSNFWSHANNYSHFPVCFLQIIQHRLDEWETILADFSVPSHGRDKPSLLYVMVVSNATRSAQAYAYIF